MMSAQGMLDEWAVRNSRWKKTLAKLLYEHVAWTQSACIQVNTNREADSVRALGLRVPLCVLPNGVDLPTSSPPATPSWTGVREGRRVMLYLGRIHPKKGLVPLIEGWARAGRDAPADADAWDLVIAGWDQGGHQEDLALLTRQLGIEDRVHLVGPRFGSAKHAAFAHASAFVLPSFSEGMPMAVLEAWAHGLPVMQTAECNLPEGFATGAAVQIAPRSESVAAGLCTLFAMDDAELRAMGAKGRRLVETRFAWPHVAQEVRGVYEWLVSGGATPGSVRVD